PNRAEGALNRRSRASGQSAPGPDAGVGCSPGTSLRILRVKRAQSIPRPVATTRNRRRESGEMNMRIANLACVLVAFCAATTVLGQTLERGEISGTVYDPNHAVVPRAEVTLSSPSTGFERTVPSDDSGSYVFTQVPAGEYQITVTAAGFAATKVTSVELHVGDSLTMDVTLTIQGPTQTVEVTAEPGVLASTEGVSQLISSESVANLPLAGRDYRDLAQLSPS